MRIKSAARGTSPARLETQRMSEIEQLRSKRIESYADVREGNWLAGTSPGMRPTDTFPHGNDGWRYNDHACHVSSLYIVVVAVRGGHAP